MTATVTEAPAVQQDLRCTVSRDDLLAALRHVTTAVGRHPAVPVLGGVLVEAAGGALTLTGFDYEVHTRATVLSPGSRGRALLPARELQRMLAALDKRCDVGLRVEATFLRVVGAGVVYTVPLLPVEDYPTVPDHGDQLVARMTGERLQQLARVCVAAGIDGSLPVLTGVLLEVADGRLCAAATDRYRLATVTGPPASAEFRDGAKMLVPAAVLRYAAQRFRKAPHVTIRTGDARVSVEAGPEYISVRLIEGEFPKVRSIIPDTLPITAALDSGQLQRAVAQVAVGIERNCPVRLRLAEGVLELRGAVDEDPAVGVTAAKDVPADVAGTTGGVRTAFNPGYLLDGLRAVGGDRVVLGLQEPVDETETDRVTGSRKSVKRVTRPMVVTSPDDEAFTYLVMPVRTAS